MSQRKKRNITRANGNTNSVAVANSVEHLSLLKLFAVAVAEC